jgi:hypothetical protein
MNDGVRSTFSSRRFRRAGRSFLEPLPCLQVSPTGLLYLSVHSQRLNQPCHCSVSERIRLNHKSQKPPIQQLTRSRPQAGRFVTSRLEVDLFAPSSPLERGEGIKDGQGTKTRRLALIYGHWSRFLAYQILLPVPHRQYRSEGPPDTLVALAMEYFVGWPRGRIGDRAMDYHQSKLSSTEVGREQVPGGGLYWEMIQFRVPALPPGNYSVAIYADIKVPREIRSTHVSRPTPTWRFPPCGPSSFARIRHQWGSE